MQFNRRGILGLAAAAAAGPALALPAGKLPRRIDASGMSSGFAATVAAIADHATADLTDNGFPGMAIAVRSAAGETARLAIGYARLGVAEPLTMDRLFQIGSITKSMVAMALFVLAARGKLDLDAPAVAVVPELPLADRSVTVAQLLAHTAGLAHDAPTFPRAPDGRWQSASPPGKQFSYSNTGYGMLGFVVERASGLRFDRALRELVMAPLGMTAAEPVIRTADRGRYAQGYVPFPGDRPWFAGGALGEGPWTDFDEAAGSVAMTSADMLRYLAYVAALGQGRGAPLFPDALARRFVTPVIATDELGAGGRYGNGLATLDLDGSPILFHTGGMLLFSSAVAVDRASGAGVFCSVNFAGTDYRPRIVAKHGVALLRAAAAGKALPPPPPFNDGLKVEHAADFAGSFVGPNGDRLEIVPAGTGLALAGGGRLKPAGEASFVTELPPRALHTIDFVPATGRRDRLWWGDTLYGRDAAVAQPPVPPALAALAGDYYSRDAWVGGATVLARGNTLVLDGGGEIRVSPDGSWRFAAADPAVEWLRFECLVGGRPEQLIVSGQRLDRLRT